MSAEAEAAVMRSGVVALQKSLSNLRTSLGKTRGMHNTFNEQPRFSFE
jgi:hypothetical protein